MQFEYQLMSEHRVRGYIRGCEGRHVQQVVFSTFMDCLTQICFTERKIRGSIEWEGNRSWKSAFAKRSDEAQVELEKAAIR